MTAPGTAAQPVDQDGLYREPFLVVDPGMHTAMIKRVDSDSAGGFLVTGSDDKTVRVWSAEDGNLQRTIRVPAGPGGLGKIYAVAMSPDGSTIAAGGWTSRDGLQTNIYLFERATGRQLGRIGGLPNVVLHLAFSPDGSQLAAALFGANGVRLFDTQSWKPIAGDKDYGGDSYAIAFAPDGRIAATCWDGKIRFYGPGLARKRTVEFPGGQRPYGIAFSPDGSRIAVGYDDTTLVTVLDGSTLDTLARTDTSGIDNGDLSKVAWSADGKLLYAGGLWFRDGARPLRAWGNAGKGAAQDYKLTQNTISGLRAFADGRLALAAADPRLLMMDRSGSVLWQAEPRTADFRGQLESAPHQPGRHARAVRLRIFREIAGAL
jgi:WD40 repeat protein